MKHKLLIIFGMIAIFISAIILYYVKYPMVLEYSEDSEWRVSVSLSKGFIFDDVGNTPYPIYAEEHGYSTVLIEYMGEKENIKKLYACNMTWTYQGENHIWSETLDDEAGDANNLFTTIEELEEHNEIPLIRKILTKGVLLGYEPEYFHFWEDADELSIEVLYEDSEGIKKSKINLDIKSKRENSWDILGYTYGLA